MVHSAWTPNTVFRLSLIGRCQGQAVVNVFHFEATDTFEGSLTTDALAQAAGQSLATDWRTNMLAAWRPMLPTDYTLDVLRAQVVERKGQVSHTLLATDDTTGLPSAGNATGVADDLTTAVVLKWRGISANRHSRGRTYVGPINDNVTNAGILTTVTSFTTFTNNMITRYTGAGPGVTAGFRFSVYSRPYDAPNGAYTVRVPGSGLTVVNNTTDYNGAVSAITSGNVDTTLRTQRRRQIGVGS